jgi:hypothetical protein
MTNRLTRRPTTRRVLALLALATVALVVASLAHAEVTTNETQSLAFAGFVPCANGGAGEILAGTVEVHNLAVSTANGNNDRSQLQFQVHGSMVGAITGDIYRVAGVTKSTSHENAGSGQYDLSYVNNFRLVGPGPDNNLLVHEIAHVTAIGDEVVVQHDNLSIDCR